MTAQYRPDWEEEKAQDTDATVYASRKELAALRELRNECLNEVPMRLTRMAENVRAVLSLPGSGEMADALIGLGLRIRRMAEEARPSASSTDA